MTRRRFLGAICLSLLWVVPNQVGLANPPTGLANTIAKLQRGDPTRVVCFGDSVTGVYYHTGGQRAYTDMLGIALQRAFPRSKLTMINAGISGHSTVNALERIDRDVLQHNPDLVTVMFGLNDMTRVPIEDYRANLVSIITKCRAAGSDVLLCTPNNVINTSGRPTAKLIQYCDTIREVAREQAVPVADVYQGLDKLRTEDAAAWRLLLSDEIHPNMDGHKRMAEIIADAASSKPVSLDDVDPPPHSLAKIADGVKADRVIKVLAMPPYDAEIKPLLLKRFPSAKLDLTTWTVADQDLSKIEQAAQAKVRALKPDLVVIAVPRTATAPNLEGFIHSYSWIMNWSLSFGLSEWPCLVIHPAVTSAEGDQQHDELIRTLVRAQDLPLIDRKPEDKRTPTEILDAALPPK